MSSSMYYTYDKAWNPVPSSAKQRLLCGVQRLFDAVILSGSCSFSHFWWMARVIWGHASGQREGAAGAVAVSLKAPNRSPVARTTAWVWGVSIPGVTGRSRDGVGGPQWGAKRCL